ncbi:MAG TPA: 3-(methylthio)propionyl-CoA ligase [Quisquiliibacterium sp.]|nr:3-(methylthio)propionyl-CoA ligase [Quisquiliibacterium sp.]HQD82559.1 3-(methylthio)propionyl-CoA ligase [Quisquiliibacterium sp.]HQN11590.1 3-(methylthio)propionyl-CoA ligase [Quisquiliibacterium sp.]HQP66039.1 3-(methylthio)propionyl-CoA ligase [Quisquiliibacterium sp.]
MQGLMMDMPLLISSILQHADRHFGDTEIVSRRVEGDIHRYTYSQCHQRARRVADALTRLGVHNGDRIATLAWNGYRHMELYYAVGGMGAVAHTINPRLHPDQIAWIVNHAGDSYLAFDTTFLPIIEAIAAKCPTVKGWIAMIDADKHPVSDKIPNLINYETLLAGGNDDFQWPELDERSAVALCYTSGTTGNPKGAMYSHRSTVLHAYAAALPDAMGASSRDSILPVVPMFHVNAWGLPYTAPMVGAKMVFPGPALDGKSLYELFETEGVTFSAGVPTVWLGLLQHVKQHDLKFSTFKRTVIGGSACPPAMIRTFNDDYGVEVVHAWGMTELSPLGTLSKLAGKHQKLSPAAQQKILEKQGHVIYGIDMKIVGDDGQDLPWDGTTFGNLLVRGPWVIKEYFKGEGGDPLVYDKEGRGWFPTGDVATIDADGYMQITDRSKDVIKSGGEWISSIDLENLAIAHPAVANAAVIGVAHPKWDERPLLIVARKPGAEVTREELLKFYEGKIAKFWMPDDVQFVDAIPLGATGKILKTKLREQFKDYTLPTA